METESGVRGGGRAARKARAREQILLQEQQRRRVQQISRILKKPEEQRSPDELAVLMDYPDMVQKLEKCRRRGETQRKKQEEVTDDPEELKRKVMRLAWAIREAKRVVMYTGAGISTAASIPDYRGPNGVWTLLQKGRALSQAELSEADPTFTHMCIMKLQQEQLVHHVVSQNCDGLHLRSGLPRHALSELHGNMYIEVCTSCSPNWEYVRLFDVTERTALHRHATGRKCHSCRGDLRDTIVHFGERGTLEQPLNWKGAAAAAEEADAILCLGSSLKVLKKYACLWGMNKQPHRRPKLYIVNLQWTPKDDQAALKIHGKCDDVMTLLMEELGLKVPAYDRSKDPIFTLVTPLRPEEACSHTRRLIAPPGGAEMSGPKQPQEKPGSDGSEVGGATVSGGWFGRGYSKGRKRKGQH
ncbi:pyrroline-5-carboxylate reductase 1b isoform X1 [Latimeria chalumnae]|uniref:NAD-dependent protein deacetylase sirtuin-7 n=1 Tax=Latimeria chalumnae TaxID=7897 RepID=H3AKL9_LATCH|nr:PREDICTED: NAD-dependent protein deacetylase sirtuin-7 [Latimeria chalumnae]|eukprot:XP_005989117.1 PREDICTED: NAD-dependent protein deacetylase sirtuin-7 [Latimeria chalumnae]